MKTRPQKATRRLISQNPTRPSTRRPMHYQAQQWMRSLHYPAQILRCRIRPTIAVLWIPTGYPGAVSFLLNQRTQYYMWIRMESRQPCLVQQGGLSSPTRKQCMHCAMHWRHYQWMQGTKKRIQGYPYCKRLLQITRSRISTMSLKACLKIRQQALPLCLEVRTLIPALYLKT